MVRGFVVNNTGKSKHIFKRTVYPGGRVPLEDVYRLLYDNVPPEDTFLEWLDTYLPEGWEISIVEESPRKEELFAVPEVHPSGSFRLKEFYAKEDNNGPSPIVVKDSIIESVVKEEEVVPELSARDIFELRIKDNPKRVVSSITSVHKLRRALTLCKGDKRKSVLTNIIRKRIKVLIVGDK